MRTSSAAGRLPIAATLGCAAVVALAGCGAATAAPSDPAASAAPAGQLPVSVSAVTFTENLGLNAHGKRPPAPATIVSKPKTSEIATLINAQKLLTQTNYSCPMDDGQSVTLTFRDSAGGPVVATVKLATSGCEAIDITVDGRSEPARGPALGRGVAAKSLKIAGLHWMLPALG